MKPEIAVPAVAALVYRAWSRKSLTPFGIFTAFLTAVVHVIHPWSVFFTLLAVFFLSGSFVTKIHHEAKAKLTQSATGASGGEGPRNHIQVLANSVVASVLILLHAWQLKKEGSRDDTCWPRGSDVLVVGIVANYAAVASDTFSSELGILAKSKPRLITAPWRIVPPGTNGGVTSTGLGAGMLGGFIIAATSTLLLPFCQEWTRTEKIRYTQAITVAGLCGSILDSLLGALLQASVVDVHSGKIVEGNGGRKVLVHSHPSRSKVSADVREKIGAHGEGESDAAVSSGTDASVQATRGMQSAGASGTAVADEHHESRKVEVGHDILDNNAVNVLMAAMISSLRFVPQKAHPSHLSPETSAPSAPGVHDTLRSRLAETSTPATANPSTKSVKLQSAHPLEARLVQWRETQDRLKMEMLKRQFGIAEPIRRGMEVKIAAAGEWRPAVLGGSSGVHKDILEGRDCEIGWEDVFVGNELREVPSFHAELEGKMKMNW
ncbi:UMP1-domain-containing protein [Periconia macrospinosa]|uniref:UMP1-domain-containing protein n=1 Tax=Periconia macrospinosa TaxID=97972 RepID=A0A2V1DUS4_9PLEO|nr:UMP1-domain-containing protein [Periconia macrospinosa]